MMIVGALIVLGIFLIILVSPIFDFFFERGLTTPFAIAGVLVLIIPSMFVPRFIARKILESYSVYSYTKQN